NRVSAIQQMKTNVGLDKYGNVAADPSEIEEHMSLQRYLAWESANSTIVANELEAQKGKLDAQKGELEAQKKNLGELTTRTDKIDAAAAATAAKVESRTLVGVSSDGTLTRAEGAKNTISVNDGLVALSGRTDRIDAAVGAIDGRVTRNTQSIEKNSKAIAANTRTLQQHSARLDSQQRQINENHKEMKRAAAQSAALTGLFQPYSVGKFNATAAVGGYSDEQALAVGVGYRFNEQTAAKAGVAFSDGDASWNVGVNFEF
ncbi:YadA C-terminal domain-containing protein, partial [Escherichia coli]|uniref:YadA C-terminal domain-containing protein n=1 Tax=Escherichia coli TaxID=562 RepID=UPI0023619CD5